MKYSNHLLARMHSLVISQATTTAATAVLAYVLANAYTAMAQIPATRPIQKICGTNYSLCALFDNNKIKCIGDPSMWGASNTTDNIGDDLSELGDNLPYIDLAGSATIVDLKCGDNFICVSLDTDELRCAGSNRNGQIGITVTTSPIGSATGYIGDSLPAVKFGTGLTVSDFSTAYYTVCAVLTGNKVKCYGGNDFGELGLEDSKERGKNAGFMGDNLPFVNLGTNVEIASVHSGPESSHTCVILSKPTLDAQRFKCWGYAIFYQLGYGLGDHIGRKVGDMGDNLPLVDIGTESRVKQLHVGGSHTCAMLITDAIKCWGAQFLGQSGAGTEIDLSDVGNNLPFLVLDSGKTVKTFSVGDAHSCVLYDDELTMKCFGYNYYGQLGQGDSYNKATTPETMVPNLTAINLGTGSLHISTFVAGPSFTCVVFVDFSVKCFGINNFGRFGVGKANEEFIGDSPYDMGTNLTYTMFFSPTPSPTVTPTTATPSTSPTKKPTKSPTPPTKSPTKAPSTTPTVKPSSNPSLNPTGVPTRKPTSNPTNSPTKPTSSSSNSSFIFNNKMIYISIVFLMALLGQ